MIKVDYTIMLSNKNHMAVSDDAYFKQDYGPDEGAGPNYSKIVTAMTESGAKQIHPCVFDLNGHSEDDIVNAMENMGFEMDMDEDFCECMCEYDM